MANPSLAELCDLAASREGPAFTRSSKRHPAALTRSVSGRSTSISWTWCSRD